MMVAELKTARRRRACPVCADTLIAAAVAVIDGRRIRLYPKMHPQMVRGVWLNFERSAVLRPVRNAWIYRTASRHWDEVPATSQFKYDRKRDSFGSRTRRSTPTRTFRPA